MFKITPLKYNICPAVKSTIKYDLKLFSKEFNDTDRNKFGRVWHTFGHYGVAGVALNNNDYGWAVFIAASSLDFDRMFHNIAMRKMAPMSRKLQSVGITEPEELRYAGNCILKKEGGILWSNIYRIFNQDKITKIMQGETIPKYNKWSDGFVYNLQMKYGVGTLNSAFITKKLRFFKKFKNIFGLLKSGNN
ncbi:MAG: hypothetical protein LKG27_00145 [Clostridiaceae bacterium]|jgi:hypothetical protein|nr:hypothetical protein [Clostridiaceae bacterium]